MLEMAIVENIQRENLNDIELAYSYQKLLFDCGLSHQQLSERIGKSRSVITNTLRLLKLPQEIQTMLRTGSISSGHARALLSIQDPKQQRSVAEKIVSEGLTVREVEHRAQGENNRDDTEENPPAPKKSGVLKNREQILDPDLQHYQEQIQYRFGTAVKITSDSEWKGKIEIAFYNKEDCNRILGLLLR
jgi:ParB family chromosome partitioning protein